MPAILKLVESIFQNTHQTFLALVDKSHEKELKLENQVYHVMKITIINTHDPGSLQLLLFASV